MPVETVEVDYDDGRVTVRVSGALDRVAGAALADVAVAASSADARDLVVDLEKVVTFTPDGADGLARCRAAAAGLPGGVRFRAHSVVGRRLILVMAAAGRGA